MSQSETVAALVSKIQAITKNPVVICTFNKSGGEIAVTPINIPVVSDAQRHIIAAGIYDTLTAVRN